MAPAIAALLPVLGNLMDRVFPDKAAADAAKLRVMEMAQAGELAQLDADVKLATGQLSVNQVEAGNASLFVAGWRPAVGWVCALSFGFKYIGGPLLVLIAEFLGHKVTLPVFDYAEMMPILFGMLGLGVFRSYEKTKGVAK
jgi:hypothetical protein